MSAEQVSNPWGARIAIGVAMLVLISGGVYYYVNVSTPQKEIDNLKKTIQTASDPMVRAQAIRELAEKKKPDTISIITAALDDEHATVRCAAAAGLGVLGEKSGAGPLTELLKDKEPKVRRSAATALGLLKAKSAVEALAKMLLKEKNMDVQSEIVFALQRIGDTSAVGALKKFRKKTKNGDLKRAADDTIVFLEDGEVPP